MAWRRRGSRTCGSAPAAGRPLPVPGGGAGLALEPDDAATWSEGHHLGQPPHRTVWMNVLCEPGTVKQRVHIEGHTDSGETLTAPGAAMPDPETVPDRSHRDVSVTDVRPLVEHGAAVRRRPGDGPAATRRRHRPVVLADPEGDEPCAFVA